MYDNQIDHEIDNESDNDQTLPAARLLTLRDIDDAPGAAGGSSRLQRYLNLYRHLFVVDGAPTGDRATFVAAAMQIASAPTMSPPCIAAHPRVRRSSVHVDERGRHALLVDLALPTPGDLRERLPRMAAGWESDYRATTYHPPADYDGPIAFVCLTIGIPVPTDVLPDPAYTDGAPQLDTVRRALRALTNHASVVCSRLLDGLDR